MYIHLVILVSDKEQMVRADVEQVAHLTGQVLDLI